MQLRATQTEMMSVPNSEGLMGNLSAKMTERMSVPNLVKRRVWPLD